jgi:hypothetical protein
MEKVLFAMDRVKADQIKKTESQRRLDEKTADESL